MAVVSTRGARCWDWFQPDGHTIRQVIAVSESLSESHPATPAAVGLIRRAIADYASAAGIDGQKLEDVRLAVSEAVTNVVIHAYRNEPGEVHVTAGAVGNELWVLIADDGCGHNSAPERPGLGWGLALITNASDGFTLVDRAEGGTEARMRFLIPEATDSLSPADR
jgi:serine/threonine-protein kinase RsbW